MVTDGHNQITARWNSPLHERSTIGYESGSSTLYRDGYDDHPNTGYPRAKQVYWLLRRVQSRVVIEGIGSNRIRRKSRKR